MKRFLKKAVCCIMAAAVILSLMPLAVPENVSADDSTMTVTAHPDGDAVMSFSGSAVKAGRGRSGFNRDFTLLSQNDLDSITSEDAADRFFSSAQYSSYVGGTKYSARRRNNEWSQQQVTRGLSLRAAADSLGADAGTDSKSAVSYSASDGYTNIMSTMWKTRYCYASETDTSGTAADPSIGLAGSYLDSFAGHNAGDPLDVPVLMIGQENADDYNAQYMGRLIKSVSFGGDKTVLAVDNTGISYDMTITDIAAGSRSTGNIGRRQAVCTYTSDGGNVSITASGVTLRQLLDYYAITTDNRTVTVKTAEGKTVSVKTGGTDKYFVAYEASANGKALSNTGSDIMLLCPGTSESDAVVRNVKSIRLSLNKPLLTKAKRKSRTSVYVKWTKVSGASGYQVSCSYRRTGNGTIKTVNSESKISASVKGLKKGQPCYVKVRAYRKAGTKKSYSAWSAVTGIK